LPGVGAGIGARVASLSLGAQSFPVDRHIGRMAARLGLIEDARTTDRLRHVIEECVSTPSRLTFYESMSIHAETVCLVDLSRCGECVLLGECPTGRKELGVQARKRPAAAPKARVKTVRTRAKAVAKRAVRSRVSTKQRKKRSKR